MKRKKPQLANTAPAVSARVVVYEMPAKSEEIAKRYRAFAMAAALHEQAVKNGEPVDRNFTQHVTEQHKPAGKLLKTVSAVQNLKKAAAALQPVNEEKQSQKERDYQHYRKVFQELCATEPKLRRARPYRAATVVRPELIRRGEVAPSIRTLRRAFTPPK
jgi:hypothetical protein